MASRHGASTCVIKQWRTCEVSTICTDKSNGINVHPSIARVRDEHCIYIRQASLCAIPYNQRTATNTIRPNTTADIPRPLSLFSGEREFPSRYLRTSWHVQRAPFSSNKPSLIYFHPSFRSTTSRTLIQRYHFVNIFTDGRSSNFVLRH